MLYEHMRRLHQQVLDAIVLAAQGVKKQLTRHVVGMAVYYTYSPDGERVAYLIINSGTPLEYTDTKGIELALKEALDTYPDEMLIHLVGGYVFTPQFRFE